MTKIEIDTILAQQSETIYELIETMPTPEIWHIEFNRVVSLYKKDSLVSDDPGVNYIRSGIKEFVSRLLSYAKKHTSEDPVYIKKKDISLEVSITLSIDDLLNDYTHELMHKVYPHRLIECVEIYQKNIDAIPKVSMVSIDTCSCGEKMKVDLETGCISCQSCGLCKESALALFKEDRGAGSGDSQKIKSNTYKVSKHFETWLNRILAIEVRAGAYAIVPKIKEYFRGAGVPKDLIEYTGIRKFLKKNNLKDYYETISWFLKEVTGRSPPDLTDSERMDIAYRFDVIIDTFDRIRNSTDAKPLGRTYYPFFIYKIIQTKFANRPEKLRLLNYIHVQSEKTLEKNESLYHKILQEARNSKLYECD